MITVTDKDILAHRDRRAAHESQYIKSANNFAHEAYAMFEEIDSQKGDLLPWRKTHNKFAFRDSEISIWAGANGVGKSMVMGFVALHLLRHTTVLIASMELPPARTYNRIMQQAATGDRPTEQWFADFTNYVDNSLYLYDQVDTVETERIFDMIHYAAEQLHVKHVMIDSLVKCGINQSENEPQKKFVDRLAKAAKEHQIHIHLVNHLRKPAQGYKAGVPTRYDIKGAGEITDLADNVIIVAKNETKAEKKAKQEEYDESEVDFFFRIDKQRFGEFEGTFGFYWHPRSLQWTEKQDRPMVFEL